MHPTLYGNILGGKVCTKSQILCSVSTSQLSDITMAVLGVGTSSLLVD